MKKIAAVAVFLCLVAGSAPAYAFVDYFFGGSSNAGAIDNSFTGDMRAWWTGNPGYQFNPFWSGPTKNPAGQQAGVPGPDGAMGGQPAAPPPAMNYHQGPGAQMPYGQQPQPAYGGGVPAGYQQQYAPPPQGYQPQPAYPPAASQPPQGYQGAPQGYQIPQQAAQMPVQGYQGPPQGYQQPPQQRFYQGENGMYGGAGFVPGQPPR